MFWRRKPKPALHPSAGIFIERIREMGPEHWAFALFESARIWHPGPLDQQGVSEGIAQDPVLVPVVAVFQSPTVETRRLTAAVQAARQQSQIAGALVAMGSALTDPERGTRIIWLGDSLAQLAAVALAYQDRLPLAAVERALSPFAEALDIASLLSPKDVPSGT